MKKYADLFSEMERAFAEYIADVKKGRFPASEHANTMDPQAFRSLMREIHMLPDFTDRDEDSPARYH